MRDALRRDAERVRRRKAVDLLEERARLVDAFEFRDQEVGYAPLVDAVRRLREHENGSRLRREGKEPPGRVVVVERPHAEVVTGTESLRLRGSQMAKAKSPRKCSTQAVSQAR